MKCFSSSLMFPFVFPHFNSHSRFTQSLIFLRFNSFLSVLILSPLASLLVSFSSMALSNRRFEINSSKFQREEEGSELGFVRLTKGLRSKRILLSKHDVSNSEKTPVKRSKSEMDSSNSDRSMLESLHQDILIRILCHVDHDDLVSLKRVSKNIRNAVLEAKKSHFDYSTPRKTLPFRDSRLVIDSSDQDYEIEPPNAPSRRRFINRESDLSKISMVLFK